MPTTDQALRIRRGEPNGSLCNMFRNELSKHIMSLPESDTLKDPARDNLNSPRPMTLPDGSVFLYAETGPEVEPVPIGSVCLIVLQASSPSYKSLPTEVNAVGEIKRMIVLEGHQQMGAAKSLLRAIEFYAREAMGLQYLAAETWKGLETAPVLYEKAGYHERDCWGAYVPDESNFYEKWLGPRPHSLNKSSDV